MAHWYLYYTVVRSKHLWIRWVRAVCWEKQNKWENATNNGLCQAALGTCNLSVIHTVMYIQVSPVNNGWGIDSTGHLVPKTTVLPPAPEVILVFVQHGFESTCATRRCKCCREDLVCLMHAAVTVTSAATVHIRDRFWGAVEMFQQSANFCDYFLS